VPSRPNKSRGRAALFLVPLAAAIVAMVATAALTPGEAKRAQAALPRFTLPMSPGADEEPIASDADSFDDLQDAEPEPEAETKTTSAPTKQTSPAAATPASRRERSRFLARNKRAKQSPQKKTEEKKAEVSSAAPTEKGTLVAMAIGASCAFAIDGTPMGTSSSVRKKVAPGNHAVSCRKVGGTTRTRSVSVQPGKASVTVFKF
jgi:hypothetical protein